MYYNIISYYVLCILPVCTKLRIILSFLRIFILSYYYILIILYSYIYVCINYFIAIKMYLNCYIKLIKTSAIILFKFNIINIYIRCKSLFRLYIYPSLDDTLSASNDVYKKLWLKSNHLLPIRRCSKTYPRLTCIVRKVIPLADFTYSENQSTTRQFEHSDIS